MRVQVPHERARTLDRDTLDITTVRLELDLDDAHRLVRLVALACSVDVVDPGNDRVLAYVDFQTQLAEKAVAQ